MDFELYPTINLRSRSFKTTLEAFSVIKLSWRREAKPLEPKLMVNPRLMELETAKEILEEVFHVRPSDVEDMIQRRLVEDDLRRDIWSEEAQWPQEFCLSE